MFVAHAPAGYLVGAAVAGRRPDGVGRVLTAAVAGALAPDLDMLYFHWVDHGRVNHHYYATHTLIFWAVACGALAPIVLRWRAWAPALWALFLGAASHIVLDTVVGGIMWRYPWDTALTYLFTVEPRLNPYAVQDVYGVDLKGWVINMITHWTMAFEGLIVLAAALTFLVRRARSAPVVTEQT